ncbi:MAG: ATP-binding protein [Candidatus Desulfatibia sp.]|uniref:ATP-binding protein n=1 Tax=Candidatus Desulfatibia sp. TaxID=3101189 RepID=UPI002F2C4B74
MAVNDRADSISYDRSVVSSTKVVVISKDETVIENIRGFLEEIGYSVHTSSSVKSVIEIMQDEKIDIAVVDFDMREEDRAWIVSEGKKSNLYMEFIGIFEKGDLDLHFSAFDLGFIGFMLKPLDNLNSYKMMFYQFAKRVYSNKKELISHSSLHSYSEELNQKNRELDAKINEIERAMTIAAYLASPVSTLDEKLDMCLKVVLEQFEATKGSVLLIDHEKNEMEIRAATDSKLIGLRQPLEGESPSAWVAKHARPLNVGDVKEESDIKASGSSDYSRDSFLSYPIKGVGKVLGVFNVTNKRVGGFTKEDEKALFRFMDRVAVTIENATLGEELKIKHGQLIKLEKLKNNLTHMIVHDLKGPIGEIKANLSMFSSEKMEDFEREIMLTAQLGADQLLGMVMDILDVNKMEEGKFHLNREDVDLKEIIDQKAAQLEALLKLENKLLETRLESDNYIINADGLVITRILQNFLANAVNYTPEGETVAIIVEDAGPDKIRIAVQDGGPGVPDEFKEKIFEKFGTVSGDDRKSKMSTGLGLTFCKMAVEAHGGEIGVENAPDGGSIFYFTLPRA